MKISKRKTIPLKKCIWFVDYGSTLNRNEERILLHVMSQFYADNILVIMIS